MTEPSMAESTFAPASPLVKKPRPPHIIPVHDRVRVFNRDLSKEDLAPLTSTSRVPGRPVRRIAGYLLLVYGTVVLGALLGTGLTAFLADRVQLADTDEHRIASAVTGTLDVLAFLNPWIAVIAIVMGATGLILDYIAYQEWLRFLTTEWHRIEGHLVLIQELPGNKRYRVRDLVDRLDNALREMDPTDPEARAAVEEAHSAISRFIDLPAVRKGSRKVALSSVDNVWVQKVREQFQTAAAAEAKALEGADNAIVAVEKFVQAAKAAAKERKIIELAKTIVESSE